MAKAIGASCRSQFRVLMVAVPTVFTGMSSGARLAARACQVFCVRQVELVIGRGESFGVDEGELGECLLPVGGDLSFDQASFGFAFRAAAEPGFLGTVTGPLSSMVQMASHSSFTTASPGKCPQFLMILRSSRNQPATEVHSTRPMIIGRNASHVVVSWQRGTPPAGSGSRVRPQRGRWQRPACVRRVCRPRDRGPLDEARPLVDVSIRIARLFRSCAVKPRA
jgi:hypothetical protein